MDLKDEIWKDVVGYEGVYMISSVGRLKNLSRMVRYKDKGYIKKIGERIITPNKLKLGYILYVLHINGTKKPTLAHRLVAEAFILNPDKKPEVNHINSIKDDNRVENLEWCTSSENQLHAVKMGLQKNFNEKIVLNTQNGIYYNSITEAAASIGMRVPTLSRCLKGIRKNKTNFILA